MAKSTRKGKKPVNLTPACFTRHLIGKEEERAVRDLLKRTIAEGKAFDRYGGVEVDAYEKEFAEFVGDQFATAVSSGTAAVHTAVSAFQFEPGREIVCPPITDPGGVGPVLMNLCIPVFADTEPWSFNVSAEGVEKAITERTAAIMVAHIGGDAADMDGILAAAKKHRLPVIEDCAQAHGTRYRGKVVGSFGTVAAFSMMSGKQHTSGGQGGMVVTNDEELYWNAKRFADRGKPFHSDADSNLFLGLNYRMTDLEACVGRVQLRKLPEFVARRRRVAERLEKTFKRLSSVRLGRQADGAESTYWFLRIHIDESRLTVSKQEFVEALKAAGVPAAPTYTSIIYRQKWFRERNTFGKSRIPWTLAPERKYDYEGCCPNAERALAEHFMMACHESIADETVDAIAAAFEATEKKFLK